MKFLEAQRLKEQEEKQETKQAPPHANKMMGTGQTKNAPSGKRSAGPITHDDASALAKSLGVDLATVTGTGQNGQILPRDVRRTAEEIEQAKQSSTGAEHDSPE